MGSWGRKSSRMLKMIFISFLTVLNCPENAEITSMEYTNITLAYKTPVIGGCGNLLLAYRFKFRDTKDSSITCIVRCPNLYGEGFFENGKSYKAKLSFDHITDSLKDYTIVNTFETDSNPIYLVTEIKKQ
jgi:hypothetical protein